MMSPRRKALYAASALALAAVALLPGTGWLVRQQILGAVMAPAPVASSLMAKGPNSRWLSAQDRVLEHNPKDFDLQLAGALQGRGEEMPTRLRELQNQFPDQPAVFALRLRYLSNGPVKLGRSEEQATLEPPRSEKNEKPSQPEKPISAESLADFEQTARRGEELAPNNAYFPAMLAMGLFAAHQDSEAREALQRAASRSEWEEYVPTEVEGKWRLAQAANGGEIGTFPRLAISAAVLFPHYASLRSMSRLAIAQAVEAETAGRTEDGFAIRRSVSHLGALLRAQASSVIGSLVGQAITRIAVVRPGGAPALPRGTDNDTRTRRVKAITEAYYTYLGQIGHPEEATWFRGEVAAGEKAKDITKRGFAGTTLGSPAVDRLIPFWAAAQIVLANIVALVILGLVAAGARRFSPRLGAGSPLSAPTIWGMTLGLTAPVLGFMYFRPEALPEPVLVGAALAYLAVVIGVPIKRRFALRDVLRGALSAAVTIGALAALGAYSVRQGIGGMAPLQMLLGMYSGGGDSGQSGLVYLAVGSLSLAIPALLALGLIVVRGPLRIPASHALARGFEAFAGPAAAVLLLGYTGLAVVMSEQEKRGQHALVQMAHHEGAYIATQVGEPWPGTVPDATK